MFAAFNFRLVMQLLFIKLSKIESSFHVYQSENRHKKITFRTVSFVVINCLDVNGGRAKEIVHTMEEANSLSAANQAGLKIPPPQ